MERVGDQGPDLDAQRRLWEPQGNKARAAQGPLEVPGPQRQGACSAANVHLTVRRLLTFPGRTAEPLRKGQPCRPSGSPSNARLRSKENEETAGVHMVVVLIKS